MLNYETGNGIVFRRFFKKLGILFVLSDSLLYRELLVRTETIKPSKRFMSAWMYNYLVKRIIFVRKEI